MSLAPNPSPTRLSELSPGTRGTVIGLNPTGVPDPQLLRRLSELGFLPGEPVQLMRRGPGGREPLAVQVGETFFALRRIEAQCVEVSVEINAQGRTA
ncbi:ferrous iron transport protein A [Hylemonella gracilis]|jgi:ferrous iron transport protein A|uniref:Ferrous iron transport protein A n=1 Tax=Hylemonella gracilis TaxID=80880 RepID=A0A4P6UKI2_9BURK|nr:FeoA family protein [Hylemonella gracilis]QBK03881.1 ferrous iron transport protein A [Hylemonella gracilis]